MPVSKLLPPTFQGGDSADPCAVLSTLPWVCQ